MSPLSSSRAAVQRAHLELRRAIARAEATLAELEHGLEVLGTHIRAARA